VTLVNYVSPHPAGWHDAPVKDSSIDAASLQALDDAIGLCASAINYLASRTVVEAIFEPGGGWGSGNRPATTNPVMWVGTDTPPSGGTTAGGGGTVAGLDFLAAPAS
jgi:hypothetical protein